MINLLTPPLFADGQRTERARISHTIIWGTLQVATLFVFVLLVSQPQIWQRILIVFFMIIFLGLAALKVNQLGWTMLANWLFIGGLILRVTFNAWPAGGIRSPGMALFLVFPLMAGLLLGEKGGLLTAGICASIATALAAAELTGVLPPQSVRYNPATLLALNLVYIGVMVVLVRLTTRSLRSSLQHAQGQIAERHQAERRLELALDAAAIGVWEQDLAAGTVQADERTFRMLQLPATPDHTVTSETWNEAVEPEDRPQVAQAVQSLATGAQKQVRILYRAVRGDGERRAIEAAAAAIPDERGSSVRIVGMIRDVTERKKTEEQREHLVSDLRKRIKELQLLHTTARLLNIDRPFNRSVLEELVALIPMAWLHVESCVARIVYGDMEVSTPGWRETPWIQSASFRTGDGRVVVEVAYLKEHPDEGHGPFLSEEGTLLQSITELLAAYLEHDLVERSRGTLENQLRHLQKMEALGTLAGGIAHDFNNLLMAIGGNLELALADVNEEEKRTHLGEIRKAHLRAVDLVKQILVFSRRRQATQRKVISLASIVSEASQLLRASLPSMIEIRVTTAPGVHSVSADASQIHQVVMNLGTNAGHAMAAKGGTLSLDVDGVILDGATDSRLAALKPGPYARLTVRDTGTGMSRELLDRLFEPFFTTKGRGGTGLGLSVVHGIIRDHEGAITVDSEVGHGTSFAVYLPSADAADQTGPAEADATLRGAGELILYVDDDEAIVFMMERMLRWLGYECLGFTDADAALQAFRSNPESFAAVVTDLSMPRMTGPELARVLRAIRPTLPIAISSGYGSEEVTPEACGGPVLRIHKPASPAEISQVLHTLVASK